MCNERIRSLVENIDEYLNAFIRINPYNGPSLYFHNRVIAIRRSAPLDLLKGCNWFIEYLYSLLACWGMHRMDGGARMLDFASFSVAVNNIINRTLALQFIQLENIQQQHIDLLCNVFNEETVMQTNPRLVGNSKLFHHLFPDLIPPIDNTNTLWFFEQPHGSESDVFRFVMGKYLEIHNAINWQNVHFNGPMNASRPKIIDNAIISFRIINNANAA